MTALVVVRTAFELLAGFLVLLGLFLVLAWAEKQRPETPEEERTHEPVRVTEPNPWDGFDVARAHWEEKGLREVASFSTEWQKERVISMRRPQQ